MSGAGASLSGLGQIALTVRDVPAAAAFYQDVLGLQRLAIEAPPFLAFFDLAGVRLMLSTPESDQGGPGGAVLYFRVDGIRRSYDELRQRGVRFADQPHLIARMPDHDLWMAFFQDPSGNTLAIMSEEPKADR